MTAMIENRQTFILSRIIKTMALVVWYVLGKPDLDLSNHMTKQERVERKDVRKVANSSLSRLVAQFQIFRRLLKGKFDAYVL